MPRSFQIQEIPVDDLLQLKAIAKLSTVAARQHSPDWLATVSDAMTELERCIIPENLSRMALHERNPVGWISAFPVNNAVWEIHPLLVDPSTHGEGVGSLLVKEVEKTLTVRGVRTIQLSTSDATHATTLSGKDLYIDPLGELQKLDVTDSTLGHAYQFWIRSGYKVVGVLPDAEGMGIPSICFAKRLVPFSTSYR
ncbi:MAG: GNAT family N-acetyltransferase [Granulosicoccus sp.]